MYVYIQFSKYVELLLLEISGMLGLQRTYRGINYKSHFQEAYG